MKKIKVVGIIFCVILLVVMIGRIIYVNVAYPFAGIYYKEQDESVSFKGILFKISNATIFDKSDWLNYIKSKGIEDENVKFKLYHSGISDKENMINYNRHVSYNPNEDFKVLVIEATNEDLSDSNIKVLRRELKVVESVNSREEFYDTYYADELSSLNENSGKAIKVYIIKQSKDLYVQTLEVGNNVMIKLNPTVVGGDR